MSQAMAYCDYNAGAPLRTEARAAMLAALDHAGNASSVHPAGRRARAMIEAARGELAGAIGARAENVIFTSGATEALHLALRGARAAGAERLLVSAIEHDALWQGAQSLWPEALTAPVTPTGAVDLEALSVLLRDAPGALVAIMLANNETGAIQPVHEAARLVREAGGSLLVDAAQGLGRVPVDLQALDASYLVASAHKIGGPPGAGLLALAPGAPFVAPAAGGGQERGRRPGTENAPAIAGFAAAAVAAVDARATEAGRLAALRDAFEAGLPRDAVRFAADGPRLPNTSLFALPGLAAETALIGLDLEGVALSSGAACSSGKVQGSRVLAAMGVAPELAVCALRASFGHGSTQADVDRALSALAKVRARATARLKGAA